MAVDTVGDEQSLLWQVSRKIHRSKSEENRLGHTVSLDQRRQITREIIKADVIAPLLARTVSCCFCGSQCESLAALKSHSGECREHPLWEDAERFRNLRVIACGDLGINPSEFNEKVDEAIADSKKPTEAAATH